MPKPRTPAARPELVALLQHAKLCPEDDAPRLVLADWLEEHGDESERDRAELIRAQCALEPLRDFWHGRGRPPALEASDADLRRRESELLACRAAEWLAPLKRFPLRWEWRRGLLRGEVSASGLQKAGALKLADTEAWAWVEGMGVHGGTPLQLQRLVDNPLLATLSALDLNHHATEREGLRSLLQASWLPGLRELKLSNVCLSDCSIAELASCAELANLSRLSLVGGNVGEADARALAGSRHLRNLTHLELRASLRPEGARALATSPNLARLQDLNLGNARIPEEGVVALAGSPYLGELARLDLNGNKIGEVGARALAGSPHLGKLAALDLGSTQVGGGAVAFLSSPRMAGLRSLNLGWNGIDSAGVAALVGPAWQAPLTALDLHDNPLGDEGVAALARSPNLARLTRLNLARCGVGPAGMQALAQSPHAANLTVLALDHNPLGVEGAVALAQSPHLRNLATLSLHGCQIGPEGARALAASPNLAGLRALTLNYNPVGAEGRRRWRSLPTWGT